MRVLSNMKAIEDVQRGRGSDNGDLFVELNRIVSLTKHEDAADS